MGPMVPLLGLEGSVCTETGLMTAAGTIAGPECSLLLVFDLTTTGDLLNEIRTSFFRPIYVLDEFDAMFERFYFISI